MKAEDGPLEKASEEYANRYGRRITDKDGVIHNSTSHLREAFEDGAFWQEKELQTKVQNLIEIWKNQLHEYQKKEGFHKKYDNKINLSGIREKRKEKESDIKYLKKLKDSL